MISEKQLKANQENAKLGGVKTEAGKEVSRMNALKHGILKQTVSDYEKEFYENFIERLDSEYKPIGLTEKMLVERIGIYYLKLFRVAKAENEFIKATLNPRIVETKSLLRDYVDMEEQIVKKEGYVAKIGIGIVEKLANIYLRYETTIENRLYRAIKELEKVQNLRKQTSK